MKLRNLARIEWLLLLLVICIWLPQFCVYQEKDHYIFHEDPSPDIASPETTPQPFYRLFFW